MAERYIHELIDDIDGSHIADGTGERVEFALRGVAYRIDLTHGNINKLENALAPFIESAEKLKGSRNRSVASTHASSAGRLPKEQLSAVRAWASKNGRKVSSRGRIPAAVIEAYEAAHAH